MNCPGSSVGRALSVVGSNPTQGSFFFKKRESCPGRISLPCLLFHMHALLHVHVHVYTYIYMYVEGSGNKT